MVPPLVTKLTLSVLVAMWIRETGSGPPTHSRAPPKALASPAGLGQAQLVASHTQTSLAHWNPSWAGLASQTRTCISTLRLMRTVYRTQNVCFIFSLTLIRTFFTLMRVSYAWAVLQMYAQWHIYFQRYLTTVSVVRLLNVQHMDDG
jgi:hypothetical protein